MVTILFLIMVAPPIPIAGLTEVRRLTVSGYIPTGTGNVPTVSSWGLVILALLVLGAGSVVLRRRRALPVAAVALFACVGVSDVMAQAPFVDGLIVTNGGLTSVTAPGGQYLDIPNSIKTLTLPAGTAVITWSAVAEVGNQFFANARVRPAIGAHAPLDVEGIRVLVLPGTNDSSDVVAGTWVTEIEGGTMDVRIQVQPAGSTINFNSVVSWSLVVYPQTSNPVPAVGNLGLASWSWCCLARVRC